MRTSGVDLLSGIVRDAILRQQPIEDRRTYKLSTFEQFSAFAITIVSVNQPREKSHEKLDRVDAAAT